MTETPITPPKPPETLPVSKPVPMPAPAPLRPAIPLPAAARPAIPPVIAAAKASEKPVIRETVPVAPRPRSAVLPVLYMLGFVILGGAIAWIWKNPQMPEQMPGQMPGQMQENPAAGAMQAQLDDLQSRISRLEARPESRSAAALDAAPLLARIAALEAKQSAATPDLAPIRSQLAALEARPIPSPADAALTQRVQLIARVQTIAAALEAGHKLGNVPDAPPALLRFAELQPPTQAGLRLAFPAAARAGLIASRPIDPDMPVLSRIWGRLQELITIRQGERVLVGDPAAGVVAAAQRELDAGDLAGAVAALGRLNPPAEQAMSGWIEQAKALLDARAALASMAARG